MPKPKRPALDSQPRATRHTKKSIEQGTKNLAKGREVTKARREAARALGLPTAGERWAMLLDGTLTIRDLDDKEIKLMRVRNADGTFAGARRTMPSHIAMQFADERLRRQKEIIAKALPTATKEALAILKDPEAKHSDKIKIIQMLWDRNLGKTPDTLRLEADNGFNAAMRAVFVERDLDDLSDLDVDVDGPA